MAVHLRHVIWGSAASAEIGRREIAQEDVVLVLRIDVGAVERRARRGQRILSKVACALASIGGTGVPSCLSTVVTAIASVNSKPANSRASALRARSTAIWLVASESIAGPITPIENC
ncbi:hypothetical protein AB5I41_10235 [Sphingomonas sp. MMS24-JH45]